MSTSEHQQFDICILCALPEEAERLKEVFSHASKEFYKDQPPVVFERSRNSHLKRIYDHTTITNSVGEQLNVLVTWLADNGPIETSLQLQLLLQEFNPLFAAMTGTCAGDRKKVKLGDIIVADQAFLYDVGKIVEDENGRPKLLTNTPMWSLPTEVLHAIRGFNTWQQVVEKEPRPPSIPQQRDWLLSRLLAPNTLRIDDIPDAELAVHVPDLITIIQELRKGGPDTYLTSDRKLNNPERVRELRYERIFPFKDAPQPTVHIAPVASGSAVRADNPFEAIQNSVRGTRAVEMEGAAFYRTLKEFGSIQYLLVKGVCDYGDADKDDSYHDYASRISALYLFAFLREYVTSSRFPYIRLQEKAQGTSSDTPLLPEQDQSSTQASQNGLNLFYSFAPEDEGMRQELEKHLVSLMVKRGGPIRKAYANNIHAGLSNNAAVFLAQAQIILLLISPRFIANDNLYEMQLTRAFELQAAGKARIVPILLHPTELQGTPLANVVVLPRNKPPISEWKSKDAAYYEVTKEIRTVVESFKK